MRIYRELVAKSTDQQDKWDETGVMFKVGNISKGLIKDRQVDSKPSLRLHMPYFPPPDNPALR
jgi:hypothetical protein